MIRSKLRPLLLAVLPLMFAACSDGATAAATGGDTAEQDAAFNEAQLAAPAELAWRSHRAFERALAEKNEAWAARAEPWVRCAYGSADHTIDISHVRSASQDVPDELPEMAAVMAQVYKASFRGALPDEGRHRFDFSAVPAAVDHGPTLARLDALFAEVETVCRKRDTEVAAALAATYGDEIPMGEGAPASAKRTARLKAITDADVARIDAIAAQIAPIVAAHREAIRQPVLDALAAG